MRTAHTRERAREVPDGGATFGHPVGDGDEEETASIARGNLADGIGLAFGEHRECIELIGIPFSDA